jgi:hypothetical protein
MSELFQAAFMTANLFYTVLLIIVFIYWLTVFIGVLDLGSFDFDVDTDVDVDVDIDADVDADTDVDAEGGLNPALAFLAFFNLGKVPFMIFLSFLALFLWIGALLGNHYLGETIPIFGLAWALPNLLLSLSLTKACTAPLKTLFEDEENEFKTNQDIIGKIGTATLLIDDESISQLSIPNQHGSPLLVRAKALEGKEVLKGYQAIVVHHEEDGNYFLVEPFIS